MFTYPVCTCSKSTRGTPGHCSDVSIVNFEQLNAGWVLFTDTVTVLNLVNSYILHVDSTLFIRSQRKRRSFQTKKKKFQRKTSFVTRKYRWFKPTEAVLQRCSVKKGVLKILQNSQENTCARASFF